MIKLVAGAFLLALAGAAAVPSLAEESGQAAVAPQASGLAGDAAQATASDDSAVGDLKLGDEASAVEDSAKIETMTEPADDAIGSDEEADD